MSIDVFAPLSSISGDAVSAVIAVSTALVGLAGLLVVIRVVTSSVNELPLAGDGGMSSSQYLAFLKKYPAKFEKDGLTPLVPEQVYLRLSSLYEYGDEESIEQAISLERKYGLDDAHLSGKPNVRVPTNALRAYIASKSLYLDDYRDLYALEFQILNEEYYGYSEFSHPDPLTHVNLSGKRHPDSLESQHGFNSSKFF